MSIVADLIRAGALDLAEGFIRLAEPESVPQPCLLHEGDAHYIQECGGEGK